MAQTVDFNLTKKLLDKDLLISQNIIKSFQNLMKNQVETHKQYSNIENVFIAVKDLDEEQILGNAFEELYNRQRRLNQIHLDYINHTQSKIQINLNSFDQEIKLVKNKILNYQNDLKKITKQTNDLKKKLNSQQDPQGQVKQQIDALNEDMKIQETALSTRVRDYVIDRNAELKYLIQQHINVQMQKHANCLQLLSEFNKMLQTIQ